MTLAEWKKSPEVAATLTPTSAAPATAPRLPSPAASETRNATTRIRACRRLLTVNPIGRRPGAGERARRTSEARAARRGRVTERGRIAGRSARCGRGGLGVLDQREHGGLVALA